MPFTGVIRFRHRPGSSETNEIHPIFEPKDSIAISWTGEPIPMRSDHSDDEYAQVQSDSISIKINRRDGSWSVLTGDGSTIARLVDQGSKIGFDHTGMIFETSVSLEAVPERLTLDSVKRLARSTNAGSHSSFGTQTSSPIISIPILYIFRSPFSLRSGRTMYGAVF